MVVVSCGSAAGVGASAGDDVPTSSADVVVVVDVGVVGVIGAGVVAVPCVVLVVVVVGTLGELGESVVELVTVELPPAPVVTGALDGLVVSSAKDAVTTKVLASRVAQTRGSLR